MSPRTTNTPDDLDLEGRLAQMANATLGQAAHVIPRIKLSATTDLKEFHGRDDDEDRARSWLAALKTAFTRAQPQEE